MYCSSTQRAVALIPRLSQSRQNLHADKRAELDYEVNVRTYREINQLKELVQALEAQLAQLERPRRAL